MTAGPSWHHEPREAWFGKPTKETTMSQNEKPATLPYAAYAVQEGRAGQKSYWTRIGRVFEHKDGKGFDIVLNALPVDARITLRRDEPREQATEQVA